MFVHVFVCVLLFVVCVHVHVCVCVWAPVCACVCVTDVETSHYNFFNSKISLNVAMYVAKGMKCYIRT